MPPRRDSSADSAARFLASQRRKPAPYRRPNARYPGVPPARPIVAVCCGFRRHARNLVMRDGVLLCAPGKGCRGQSAAPAPGIATAPRRIVVDFAEPTLRLIHDVLLDAMHANVDFSDRGALLMIAEQMVAAALGDPPCDDPPLTDREVG